MTQLFVITKIDEDCACDLAHSTWIEETQEAAEQSVKNDFNEWKSEFEDDEDEELKLEYYNGHYYCPRFGDTLHYYITPVSLTISPENR